MSLWLNARPRGAPDIYRIGKLSGLDGLDLMTASAADFERALERVPPKGRNRYVELISAILNLGRRRGLKIGAIFLAKQKKPAGRLRWLTADEWQRLQDELPDHLRQMATFALATGLRQANVTNLKWSQVDMQRQVLWVHAADTKTGQPLGIPLSDAAMAVLAHQRAEQMRAGGQHDHVFLYRGHPIQKIKTAWTKALERAGIRDFTWHGLRHTWASWHVMAGTPLLVLKTLGGWADIKSVMVYAHLAPEYLSQYANNPKPYAAYGTD